jgi:hypothetical protein
MDLRSGRVLEGKAIRSEISSSEEAELWVGTTSSGVVSLAAAALTLVAASQQPALWLLLIWARASWVRPSSWWR